MELRKQQDWQTVQSVCSIEVLACCVWITGQIVSSLPIEPAHEFETSNKPRPLNKFRIQMYGLGPAYSLESKWWCSLAFAFVAVRDKASNTRIVTKKALMVLATSKHEGRVLALSLAFSGPRSDEVAHPCLWIWYSLFHPCRSWLSCCNRNKIDTGNLSLRHIVGMWTMSQ